MNIKFFTFYLILFFSNAIISQQPIIDWSANYGYDENDMANAIISTGESDFIIAGTMWDTTSYDNFLLKINFNSSIEWSNIFGNLNTDVLYSITQIDDNYIATGFSGNSNNESSLSILKLSSTGNIISSNTYGQDWFNTKSFAFPLPEGNFFIAGTSASSFQTGSGTYGNGDFRNMILDSIGTVITQNSFGGSRLDKLEAVIHTMDNNYILAGSTWSSDGNILENNGLQDGLLIKVSPEGDFIWAKTYGGIFEDGIFDIQQNEDGEFFATGYKGGVKEGNFVSDFDFWLLKLDNNGDIIWEKTFGTEENEKAKLIRIMDDKNIIISGTIQTEENQIELYVVKTDANGNFILQEIIGGTENDVPNDAVKIAGGLIFTGYSRSDDAGLFENIGNSDVWTIKIDSLAQIITDIPAITDNINAKIFPNPTSGNVNIQISLKKPIPYEIVISNSYGKILNRFSEKSPDNKNFNIDFSPFPPGIYNIKIVTKTEIASKRIIKI